MSKSIILNDESTIKLGEPLVLATKNQVCELTECDRQKGTLKVKEFGNINFNKAFFRGLK